MLMNTGMYPEHGDQGELLMIHRFFAAKLNPILIFLLLLSVGEFILQCSHITQNPRQSPLGVFLCLLFWDFFFVFGGTTSAGAYEDV